MKKATCLVVLFAFVATATAEVEFFFTSSTDPWGLKPHPATGVAADPFVPSLFNPTYAPDYYYGYQLSPTGGPLTRDDIPASRIAGNPDSIPDVIVNPGEFAYIWIHFDENEPLDNKVTGIDSLFIPDAAWTAFYVTDLPRWSSSPFEDWSNPYSLLASPPCVGITNSPTDSAPNMYYGGGATGGPQFGDRTALLGAARWDAVDRIVHGSLNFVVTTASGVDQPWRFLNGVHVTPEPASLGLFGLMLWFMRRR